MFSDFVQLGILHALRTAGLTRSYLATPKGHDVKDYEQKQPEEAEMKNVSDFDLGRSLELQFGYMRQAIETGDEEQFQSAILRIGHVRRMKKDGTLEWQAPGFEARRFV